LNREKAKSSSNPPILGGMISNPEKTIGDDITSSREPWLGDSVALALRKLGVSGPTAGEVGRLRGCGLDLQKVTKISMRAMVDSTGVTQTVRPDVGRSVRLCQP
jgi:hypothetical protein